MRRDVIDLKKAKRQLSPHLLKVQGVSGVGLPDGTLTVYLTKDAPNVRRSVNRVFKTVAPGTQHKFAVTGTLHKLAH